MANKKMITTEDYNSIIEHFSHGFIDYYTFNTADIGLEDKTYGYDFITIEKSTNKIKATIDNELWTNGYYIDDFEGASQVNSSKTNNTIEFTGTGLTNIEFTIELSPEIIRDTELLTYKVEYPIYVRPFYRNFSIEVIFKTLTDQPIQNLAVLDGTTTRYTDSTGKVEIPISAGGKAGHNNHLIKVGDDEINLYYRIIKAEYRVGPYSTIYRYIEDTCTFKLYFGHEESLNVNQFYPNNDIYLLINGKRYEMHDPLLNEMYFDLPAFSSETLDIKFVMNGNEYIQAVKYDYTVELPIKEYDSWADLMGDYTNNEIPQVVKFTGDTIANLSLGSEFERDLKIIFTDDVSFEDNITVKNCKLVLEDLNIDEPEAKIILDNGELELNNCTFSHASDVIIKGDGNVELNDISFIDNASCININGNLTVDNCLFELADSEYVDITKIPFIKCFGDININNTGFNIQLEELDELGYSYVALLISDHNTTNGVDNNKLTQNNKFNIKNNTGSIYVIGNGYTIRADITWLIQNTNTVFGNKLTAVHDNV